VWGRAGGALPPLWHDSDGDVARHVAALLVIHPAAAAAGCFHCSTLALSKELGEGLLAGLPDAELLQPCHDGTARGRPPPRGAQQAAATAQRLCQGRMDDAVAAMQRLKQLTVQAAAGLAAGQAASGAVAAQLAPRVPPLFCGSQVRAARSPPPGNHLPTCHAQLPLAMPAMSHIDAPPLPSYLPAHLPAPCTGQRQAGGASA
jgi:hypothetical protein